MSWLPWVFWPLALIASLLYGRYGLEVFVGSEAPFKGPRLWHERWLNFLGSLVGWLVAWVLLLRHCNWPLQRCSWQLDLWDLLGGFVAFIGMTGFLPFTAVGVASGLKAVAVRAADALAKVLPGGE